MPDALTCESCLRAPATHLLVFDLPALFRRARRRKALSCAECADRILPAARNIAGSASVWAYRLAAPFVTGGMYAR